MNVKILIHNEYHTLSSRDLAALAASLPEFRRQQVLSYRSAVDQKARAVVYRLLRDELGYNPEFAYNQFGKPSVMCTTASQCTVDGGDKHKTGENAGGGRPVSFNFSHSKTIAAAALAHGTAELGLDVENTFSARRAAAAARLMTAAEKTMPKQAVKLWTLKESFIKCLGTGLYDVSPARYDFSQWVENEMFSAYGKYFFSRQFDGFHLSLCATCPISVTVLFTNINV